jgi:hypothetical protein
MKKDLLYKEDHQELENREKISALEFDAYSQYVELLPKQINFFADRNDA